MHNKQYGKYLFFFSYIIWMLVALIKYTYFKDFLPINKITRYVMYTVLALCFIKNILEFEIHRFEFLYYFCCILFVGIAWHNNKLQFAAMFMLIFSARNIDFHTICKLAFLLQISIFISTIICSQLEILEDVIWFDTGRSRHGLGFTHCMLASHFGLFIPITWTLIRKKMSTISCIICLIVNIALYKLTVGRTDILLSIAFTLVAWIFSTIKPFEIFKNKFSCILLSLIPYLCMVVSILSAYLYSPENTLWVKINSVLNGRLAFGQNALKEYGLSWFGQKITFVGMSTLYYHPNKVYNYVDNSYLNMMLIYGNIFILVYCFAMSCFLYQSALNNDLLLIICIGATLLFGILNPQSMYLSYNVSLLLLPLSVTDFFHPSKERQKYTLLSQRKNQ